MTLESNILECQLTSFSHNIKKQLVEDRNRTSRTEKRIFAACFSKKVMSIQSVFYLKNIDFFSLLVKFFGEPLYFK